MTNTQWPNYTGRGLVNLVAELEHTARSDSVAAPLDADLAQHIPHTTSTVLVLFDGLGSHQLDHPRATDLRRSHRASIDAPFATTTTVSLATVATGLPPHQHGLIAYHLWLPEHDDVINTIHMTTLTGKAIDQDHRAFLPGPNLWERLGAADVSVTTVQPSHFDRSPLSLALYRGASFAGYTSLPEAVEITVEAASRPHSFVFLYVPHVDFAAHLSGQASDDYSVAMAAANDVWAHLSRDLGPRVTLVGSADHGHIDIAEGTKVRLSQEQCDGTVLYGDARALYVKGDGASLADELPATWVPIDHLVGIWGPGPAHPAFADRRPDGVLFADPGTAIFHPRNNDRLVGHHGGLTEAERLVPILVR